MSDVVYLLATVPCDTCEDGEIENPLWKGFKAFSEEWERRHPFNESPHWTQWWNDRASDEERWWRQRGVNPHCLPPDVLACPDCEGRMNRTIRLRTSMDKLKKLGIFEED